jgi:vitamin B12/bleomycin/antimicrobial peptide transport system ATP-binding/permease protein
VVVPHILIAPAYFAKTIELGAMMQTADAFGSVQGALSYFVSAYRTMAEWRAVVARLDGFETSIESAEALVGEARAIDIATSSQRDGIDLAKLLVSLPNGVPLVSAEEFSIKSDADTLVTGPSGAGKSTLFRAIAGIWPFGSGSIAIPANATLMMLPQRPYFPIGSLRAAITYPGPADSFPADKVRDVVAAVGLGRMEPQLDQEGHWNQTLSLGEQQRLAIARALLHTPQYLFLDEATASLDEPSEARLYHLLAEDLPDATIISIGHRSTLHAFHQRNVALAREGDHFALRPRTTENAAAS